MKRWLTLWTGHLLLVLIVACFLLALYFARGAMAGHDYEEVWWHFVLCALSVLLMVILGIIATVTFKTHRDRYYLRRLWHEQDTNLSGVPIPTGPWVSVADEAHSADEEVSSDGR